MPFRSAKFPQLRFLVHTGFDVIEGVENLKHIFLPLEPEQASHVASHGRPAVLLALSNTTTRALPHHTIPQSPLPAVQAKVSDATPLFLPVTADGSKGSVLSHADVLQKKAWPVVAGVLSKQLIKIGV